MSSAGRQRVLGEPIVGGKYRAEEYGRVEVVSNDLPTRTALVVFYSERSELNPCESSTYVRIRWEYLKEEQ